MSTDAPADAFALLGSEVRIDILRTLAEDDPTGFDHHALSFSEIYDRVDVGDSGQLSYHLDKLTGHFLRKTEEGYRLRYAGRKVVWAIRAGTFVDGEEREFEADGTCYACGERTLRARAANGWIAVDCRSCGTHHASNPLPPWNLEEGSPDRVLRTLDRVVRHRTSLVGEGICPECSGPVAPSIREDPSEEFDVGVVPVFRCAHCGYWFTPTFGLLALEDRTVEAFLIDRGTDPEERPYWDVPICVDDGHTTVRSREPWRVDVAIEMDDERLRATFDGDARLEDVTVER